MTKKTAKTKKAKIVNNAEIGYIPKKIKDGVVEEAEIIEVSLPSEQEDDKHPGGRPLKFESVEELQEKIDAYFQSCFEEKWFDEVKRDKNGRKVVRQGKLIYLPVKKRVQIKPISITGLAVALDTSRKVLIDYEEKDEFSNTIKKAKQFCENAVEDGMFRGDINPTAGIFNLKNNYGWHDKTEQELSTKDDKPISITYIAPNDNKANKETA